MDMKQYSSNMTCSFCHCTSAVRSCTCGLAYYCGRVCQRSDWKSHKSACPPFMVRPVPGKGRGLIATRKLNLGMTILREDPVLVVSKQMPNYEKLLADFLKHCKKTQLDIMKLQDSLDEVEDLTDQKVLISKLKRIVEVNSIISYEANVLPTKNVFLTASRLNHDCRPNLAWHPVKGRIVLNVMRSVEKGEELTVSYYAQSVGAYQRGEGCPTLRQRREKLLMYRFDCRCNICQADSSADDAKRREFQTLDLAQEDNDSLGIGELLVNAQRKLELTRELDDQVIFLALIDCWKLSQFLALNCQDLAVIQQANVFKAEAAMFANILGPCAVQAYGKFDCLRLEEVGTEEEVRQ